MTNSGTKALSAVLAQARASAGVPTYSEAVLTRLAAAPSRFIKPPQRGCNGITSETRNFSKEAREATNSLANLFRTAPARATDARGTDVYAEAVSDRLAVAQDRSAPSPQRRCNGITSEHGYPTRKPHRATIDPGKLA